MKIQNEPIGHEVGEATKEVSIHGKSEPGIKFALGSMIFNN